ncbi:MAG: type II toxin-antitoxin system RelE/ParE family toxin [Pseudomonadales bacterium]|nr:type II toxin-antitoxin system RelE/ParE family toxin [Pseudomonadales bacterium]
MPTYQLFISPAAREDLKGIYQFGLRQWGKTQSDNYLGLIKDQLWSLTEQALMGLERPELLPDARSLPMQSHTLFYRVTANRVEIIRVLHGRQDPQRHLK